MQKPRNRISGIVMSGVFAALVFAASWLRIPVPTPLGNTRIHLGNVLCLLSGFVLGPLRGGMAAGLGSMLYDFTDPVFLIYAPFTLIEKFIMGWLCGLIGSRVRAPASADAAFKFTAAIAGQGMYIVLYLTQCYMEDVWVKLVDPKAAWADIAVRAPVSLINGFLSVAVAVPLALTLQRALKGKI